MGDSSLVVVDGIIKKLLSVQDKPTQTEVTDITTDEIALLCRKIRTVRPPMPRCCLWRSFAVGSEHRAD